MPFEAARGDSGYTLIVEDDPTLSALYEAYLENISIKTKRSGSARQARLILDEEMPAVILLDLGLPDKHGHEFLNELREEGVSAPVIVITSAGSITMAVESMRLGAHDFLVKPFSPDRLQITVRNAIELTRLKRLERRHAETGDRFEGFVGASPVMQAVYRLIKDVAPSKATVFITGESGTGKEVAAEAIHRLSPRSGRNFVAMNCGAIPKDLVESELFGHVRGSFTGATSNREGIAARADGGTLFLDEIGEMDMTLQSKLLRFIQTGTYQQVGGDRDRSVDVRFVCATNRDPLAEIAAGRFREDLYYRLNVVPLAMPPLRDRGSDIILIARDHLQIFAKEEGKHFDGFAPETERLLLDYDWPGNVRQLLNILRNFVVLQQGGVVTPAMLPLHIRNPAPVVQDSAISPRISAGPSRNAGMIGLSQPAMEMADNTIRPLWRIEREAIENALAICENNVGRAAAMLEIDASTIYRKKREWGRIDAKEKEPPV